MWKLNIYAPQTRLSSTQRGKKEEEDHEAKKNKMQETVRLPLSPHIHFTKDTSSVTRGLK